MKSGIWPPSPPGVSSNAVHIGGACYIREHSDREKFSYWLMRTYR